MDDTLLLYRNAKVGDTSAYDYSAKVFLSGYYYRSQNTANYMISIGMQNGDKAIAKSGSAPNAYYVLITLDSTDAQGCTQVSLPPNKVVYCEADSCFYRIISSTIDNTTVFMHEIYQPYVQFNYHNTSEQIALKDFTYTAERMGKTPTLTADFYDKECYDNIWDNDTTNTKYRFYDIFTVFRGERYYFKLTPQSQLQNTDARYKHTINFVSEREKLEHAKMFDVVTTSTPDAPVSDSSKFVFYGTLSEFADRINASLIKEGVTFSTTYNGITIFSGYHVEIKIKDGNNGGIDSSMLTKAATVSIENNSILEALGHLDTDYGVSYYVDGYTIWIADFEADLTGAGHPAIQYGEENSLLHITRQNVTKNIVTRITGYGSEDNIPYYYPNPCESGFLQAGYEKYGEPVKNIYAYGTTIPTSGSVNGDRAIIKGSNGNDGILYEYNGSSWNSVCAVPRGRFFKSAADGKIYSCSTSNGSWSESTSPIARHPYEWVKINGNVVRAIHLIYISTSTNTSVALPMYADEGDMCYIGRRGSVYRKVYTYTNGAWNNGETPSTSVCYICNGIMYMYKNSTMSAKSGDYDKFTRLAKSDEFLYGGIIRGVKGVVDKSNSSIKIGNTWYSRTNGVYQYDGSYCFNIVFEQEISDNEQVYTFLDDFYPYIDQQGGAYRCELAYITINGISLSDAQSVLFAHRELSFDGVNKIGIIIRQRMAINPNRIFYGWHYDAQDDVTVCTHSLGLAIKRNFPAVIVTKDETIRCGEGQMHYGTLIYFRKSDLGMFINIRGVGHAVSSTWYLDPQLGDNYWAWKNECINQFNSFELQNGDICEEASSVDINYTTHNFYQYQSSSKTFTQIANPYQDGIVGKIVAIYSGRSDIYLHYYNRKWYINGNATTLATHGIDTIQSSSYSRGDKISFEQIKYMQPQKNLMPSIYYNSDAKKRFFDAISYPHTKVRGKSVDRQIGEYYIDSIDIETDRGKVMNSNYESGVNVGYTFENFIDRGHPRTHVEVIDAIKPSIEDLTVTVNGVELNADMFADFCYDLLDNDDNWSVWERQDEDDSNLTLKHAHFFAKLRPLGFNLFAMAIDEAEMTVNFTSGCCMACTFKIKVDKDSKRNPIALYDNNIYRRDDDGVLTYDDAHLFAAAGTPTRYSDRQLYTYNNGTFVEYGTATQYEPPRNANDEMIHFDGDVITSNRESDVQDSQNDTTSNYVWIALEKDISTFSYPMPSVSNNMKPVKVSTTTSNDGDKFVLTHIKMPLRFVRAAEERLSKALVEYMSANNAELFHYSIKFSRIFLEESGNTYATDLNENVKLHIQYADHENKSFYVKSYTYKKVGSEPLPEISVELRENINVARYRYYNRWEFNRWDEEWNEVIREIDPIIRGVLGQGNGNGMSLVNGNMLSVLSRSLVSRNGSTMRGILNAEGGKVIGNLSVIRDDGMEMSVRDIDINVGIDEESGLRGKTKNLLTDLGILEFDETRSYEVDEMVVHNNRLMRFTQKKTAGEWDATKATNDSVSNCIFRALGVQEYNAERTTKYNVGEKFFRNNKIYNVTTEFTPKVGSAYVTETVFANSTRKMDIIANFTEKDDTTTLRRTVDDVSRIINNLNEQILNEDSGIAIVMENVNKKLADLTSAMATENAYTRQYVAALADALKDNEFLAKDSNVTVAAGNVSDYMTQTSAVTTAATAANTELTGADVESAYNKLINFIAEVQFGQLVKDVHSAGGATDSTYAITHKIYDTSQYMVGVPVEFNKEEAYDANQMVIHLKHLYQLTAGKAADVDWGDIDPSTKVNMDDILKKIVVFSTDAYDITSGSDFLEYGMYTMAAAFCEWVQKFISDYGDKGMLYSDLDDLVINETADYKDGDGYNMFAEHTAYASSQTKVYYTVLQYAVLRMERNGIIYAASTYTKELIKDDNKHIIFNVKTIQNMGAEVTKMMEGCPTKSVVVGGEEKLCYYISIADMAEKFGYNYLYAADYLVDNETMYYDSVEKEYYLPVE